MKRFTIAAFVVALVATPVVAAPTTFSFTAAQLGSMIDPPSGDPIDYSVSAPSVGATKTGTGLWKMVAEMNAMDHLKIVDFNSATGQAAPGMCNKFEQYVGPTQHVDFTVTSGIGNYEEGYNFGGYTSNGRSAVSESAVGQDWDTLGSLPGDYASGTGLNLNVGCFDVSDNMANGWVRGIGFALIGKSNGATIKDPTLTVSIENLTDSEDVQTASMTLHGWIGGYTTNNAVFFGYQAPKEYKITQFRVDGTEIQMYGAFDDIAFQLAPEPGTMVLLGLGGLGMLIRRKRS